MMQTQLNNWNYCTKIVQVLKRVHQCLLTCTFLNVQIALTWKLLNLSFEFFRFHTNSCYFSFLFSCFIQSHDAMFNLYLYDCSFWIVFPLVHYEVIFLVETYLIFAPHYYFIICLWLTSILQKRVLSYKTLLSLDSQMLAKNLFEGMITRF